jgi:hypothetical protein
VRDAQRVQNALIGKYVRVFVLPGLNAPHVVSVGACTSLSIDGRMGQERLPSRGGKQGSGVLAGCMSHTVVAIAAGSYSKRLLHRARRTYGCCGTRLLISGMLYLSLSRMRCDPRSLLLDCPPESCKPTFACQVKQIHVLCPQTIECIVDIRQELVAPCAAVPYDRGSVTLKDSLFPFLQHHLVRIDMSY